MPLASSQSLPDLDAPCIPLLLRLNLKGTRGHGFLGDGYEIPASWLKMGFCSEGTHE